jgi:hypothetical protein
MTVLGNELGVPEEKSIAGLLIRASHALADILHDGSTLLLVEGLNNGINASTVSRREGRKDSIGSDLLQAIILDL